MFIISFLLKYVTILLLANDIIVHCSPVRISVLRVDSPDNDRNLTNLLPYHGHIGHLQCPKLTNHNARTKVLSENLTSHLARPNLPRENPTNHLSLQPRNRYRLLKPFGKWNLSARIAQKFRKLPNMGLEKPSRNLDSNMSDNEEPVAKESLFSRKRHRILAEPLSTTDLSFIEEFPVGVKSALDMPTPKFSKMPNRRQLRVFGLKEKIKKKMKLPLLPLLSRSRAMRNNTKRFRYDVEIRVRNVREEIEARKQIEEAMRKYRRRGLCEVITVQNDVSDTQTNEWKGGDTHSPEKKSPLMKHEFHIKFKYPRKQEQSEESPDEDPTNGEENPTENGNIYLFDGKNVEKNDSLIEIHHIESINPHLTDLLDNEKFSRWNKTNKSNGTLYQNEEERLGNLDIIDLHELFQNTTQERVKNQNKINSNPSSSKPENSIDLLKLPRVLIQPQEKERKEDWDTVDLVMKNLGMKPLLHVEEKDHNNATVMNKTKIPSNVGSMSSNEGTTEPNIDQKIENINAALNDILQGMTNFQLKYKNQTKDDVERVENKDNNNATVLNNNTPLNGILIPSNNGSTTSNEGSMPLNERTTEINMDQKTEKINTTLNDILNEMLNIELNYKNYTKDDVKAFHSERKLDKPTSVLLNESVNRGKLEEFLGTYQPQEFKRIDGFQIGRILDNARTEQEQLKDRKTQDKYRLDERKSYSNQNKTFANKNNTMPVFFVGNKSVSYLGILNKTSNTVNLKNDSSPRSLPDVLKRLYSNNSMTDLNNSYQDRLQRVSPEFLQAILKSDRVFSTLVTFVTTERNVTTMKTKEHEKNTGPSTSSTQSNFVQSLLNNLRITNNATITTPTSDISKLLMDVTASNEKLGGTSTMNLIVEQLVKNNAFNLTRLDENKPSKSNEFNNKNITLVNNTSELFSVFFTIKNKKMYLGTVNKTTMMEFLKHAPKSMMFNFDGRKNRIKTWANRTIGELKSSLSNQTNSVQVSPKNSNPYTRPAHSCENHEEMMKQVSELNKNIGTLQIQFGEHRNSMRTISFLESMGITTMSLRELHEIAQQYPLHLVPLPRYSMQQTHKDMVQYPTSYLSTSVPYLASTQMRSYPTSRPTTQSHSQESNTLKSPVTNKSTFKNILDKNLSNTLHANDEFQNERRVTNLKNEKKLFDEIDKSLSTLKSVNESLYKMLSSQFFVNTTNLKERIQNDIDKYNVVLEKLNRSKLNDDPNSEVFKQVDSLHRENISRKTVDKSQEFGNHGTHNEFNTDTKSTLNSLKIQRNANTEHSKLLQPMKPIASNASETSKLTVEGKIIKALKEYLNDNSSITNNSFISNTQTPTMKTSLKSSKNNAAHLPPNIGFKFVENITKPFQTSNVNIGIYSELLSNFLTPLKKKNNSHEHKKIRDVINNHRNSVNAIEFLDKYCPSRTIKYAYMIHLLSSTVNYSRDFGNVQLNNLYVDNFLSTVHPIIAVKSSINSPTIELENEMPLSCDNMDSVDQSQMSEYTVLNRTFHKISSSTVSDIDIVKHFLNEYKVHNEPVKESVNNTEEFLVIYGDDKFAVALQNLYRQTTSKEHTNSTVAHSTENVACTTPCPTKFTTTCVTPCPTTCRTTPCPTKCVTPCPTKFTTTCVTPCPTTCRTTPCPTKCTSTCVTPCPTTCTTPCTTTCSCVTTCSTTPCTTTCPNNYPSPTPMIPAKMTCPCLKAKLDYAGSTPMTNMKTSNIELKPAQPKEPCVPPHEITSKQVAHLLEKTSETTTCSFFLNHQYEINSNLEKEIKKIDPKWQKERQTVSTTPLNIPSTTALPSISATIALKIISPFDFVRIDSTDQAAIAFRTKYSTTTPATTVTIELNNLQTTTPVFLLQDIPTTVSSSKSAIHFHQIDSTDTAAIAFKQKFSTSHPFKDYSTSKVQQTCDYLSPSMPYKTILFLHYYSLYYKMYYTMHYKMYNSLHYKMYNSLHYKMYNSLHYKMYNSLHYKMYYTMHYKMYNSMHYKMYYTMHYKMYNSMYYKMYNSLHYKMHNTMYYKMPENLSNQMPKTMHYKMPETLSD
ncbi:hypothetical protein WDU94_006206 [Cyamophila willieti]